jgi:cholesterol transport system auxiliary component
MVQSLIVESLENTGRIEAVARDTLELRADALLMPDLRHFEAEYSGNADVPVVRVEFGCRLVKMPERNILAIKVFSATAPAARNDVPAVVDAFNQAFHDAMRQVGPWVAANLAPISR